ncbi:hypothetical protein [Sphingomonas sp.]|uniref:hypothetical protein n=1 Tax=Sphingomonas sp. TaxID=28214 RepID=UPI0035C873BC
MNAAQVLSDPSGTRLFGAALSAACLMLALFAAWRERRRARRHDPDAVGWVDWRGVQMLTLIALAVGVLLVWKGQ